MNLNDALWTIKPGNETFYFDKIILFYPKKLREETDGNGFSFNYEPGEIAGNGFSFELDGRILNEIISEDIADTEMNLSFAVTEEMDYPRKDMRFTRVDMVSHLLKEEVHGVTVYPPSEKSEMSMCVYLAGFEYPGFNQIGK